MSKTGESELVKQSWRKLSLYIDLRSFPGTGKGLALVPSPGEPFCDLESRLVSGGCYQS